MFEIFKTFSHMLKRKVVTEPNWQAIAVNLLIGLFISAPYLKMFIYVNSYNHLVLHRH